MRTIKEKKTSLDHEHSVWTPEVGYVGVEPHEVLEIIISFIDTTDNCRIHAKKSSRVGRKKTLGRKPWGRDCVVT